MKHRGPATESRRHKGRAFGFDLLGVVLLVMALGACHKENAGLWSGVCPASNDSLMKEVNTCFEENKKLSALDKKDCGRYVVSQRTGNNDHYKVGDTLNDCHFCDQFVQAGVYPAEKGASTCVSSRWMESDEFKRIQRVAAPGR